MESFPEDIVIDILTRLPVKTILRFKSVSKHWSTLPTTIHFIASHLRRSSSGNPLLIVHHGRPPARNLRFSVIDKHLTILHPDFPLPPPAATPLPELSPSVLGSCNGLLCIKFSAADLILWNPATKQLRPLPMSDYTYPTAKFICERFGFGSTHEPEPEPDYKLVKFLTVSRNNSDERLWESLKFKSAVFSRKNWAWKLLDWKLPMAYYGSAVAANGRLFWVGERAGRRDFVLTFDLVTDSFGTIELPEGFRAESRRVSEAMVMGEDGRGVRMAVWEAMWRCGCFDGGDGFVYRGLWNGVRVLLRRRMDGGGEVLGFCDIAGGEAGSVGGGVEDGVGVRVYGVCGFVESLVSVRGEE